MQLINTLIVELVGFIIMSISMCYHGYAKLCKTKAMQPSYRAFCFISSESYPPTHAPSKETRYAAEKTKPQ